MAQFFFKNMPLMLTLRIGKIEFWHNVVVELFIATSVGKEGRLEVN